MKRAKPDRKLSELVSIAVQARLGCHTCLEAHVEAAAASGWATTTSTRPAPPTRAILG